MAENFRSLPEQYSSSGYIFKLHKRGKKGIIYVATYKSEGGFISYISEIFVIKTAKAAILNFGGKKTEVPPRERIPGNEAFGSWAWTKSGKDMDIIITQSEIILQEIEDGIRPAPMVKIENPDEPLIKDY